MRDKFSLPDDELARTDELPVLAEDAVVAAPGAAPENDDSDTPDTSRLRTLRVQTADDPTAVSWQESSAVQALQEAVKAVLRELAEQRATHTLLEKSLERRDVEVADLRAEVSRQRKELDALRATAGGTSHADGERSIDRQNERLTALQHELGGRGAAPLPVLVCLSSARPERHVVSAPETLIGRGAGCGIRVVTHSVSREHARLKHENGKVVIHDCGSKNGVFVNSIRVERHELEHGDSITIGGARFRFLLEGAQT